MTYLLNGVIHPKNDRYIFVTGMIKSLSNRKYMSKAESVKLIGKEIFVKKGH